MFRAMPDMDLEPEHYRRRGARRIIPRSTAMVLIPILLGSAIFLQWIAHYGQWWEGAIVWPPLFMAGVMSVRVWPAAFLAEDEPSSGRRSR